MGVGGRERLHLLQPEPDTRCPVGDQCGERGTDDGGRVVGHHQRELVIGVPGVEVAAGVEHPRHALQGLLRPWEQLDSQRGQRVPAPRPLQQLVAEVPPEPAECGAGSGLADPHALGGPGHAPLLQQRMEGHQQVQVESADRALLHRSSITPADCVHTETEAGGCCVRHTRDVTLIMSYLMKRFKTAGDPMTPSSPRRRPRSWLAALVAAGCVTGGLALVPASAPAAPRHRRPSPPPRRTRWSPRSPRTRGPRGRCSDGGGRAPSSLTWRSGSFARSRTPATRVSRSPS